MRIKSRMERTVSKGYAEAVRNYAEELNYYRAADCMDDWKHIYNRAESLQAQALAKTYHIALG